MTGSRRVGILLVLCLLAAGAGIGAAEASVVGPTAGVGAIVEETPDDQNRTAQNDTVANDSTGDIPEANSFHDIPEPPDPPFVPIFYDQFVSAEVKTTDGDRITSGTVAIRNVSTGNTVANVSLNSRGETRRVGVPPGTYEAVLNTTRFQATFSNEVSVSSNRTKEIDVTLAPASLVPTAYIGIEARSEAGGYVRIKNASTGTVVANVSVDAQGETPRVAVDPGRYEAEIVGERVFRPGPGPGIPIDTHAPPIYVGPGDTLEVPARLALGAYTNRSTFLRAEVRDLAGNPVTVGRLSFENLSLSGSLIDVAGNASLNNHGETGDVTNHSGFYWARFLDAGIETYSDVVYGIGYREIDVTIIRSADGATGVNVTQVGTHPPLSETGGAYDPFAVTEFADKSDATAQSVPRDGETLDVVRVETYNDSGASANATAVVAVTDTADFEGQWTGFDGGTLVGRNPGTDEIAVATGSDGRVSLLLESNESEASLETSIKATLSGNASLFEETNVRLEGTGTGSCDLSAFVQGYDADGDCAIVLTELGQASADFANGNITLTQLGQVSTAFANS